MEERTYCQKCIDKNSEYFVSLSKRTMGICRFVKISVMVMLLFGVVGMTGLYVYITRTELLMKEVYSIKQILEQQKHEWNGQQ